MNRIYYAHSLRIYNTEQEQLELKQIAELCSSREIINPNGTISEMSGAYRLINQSSGVVASEYQRHIGKGVYELPLRPTPGASLGLRMRFATRSTKTSLLLCYAMAGCFGFIQNTK